VTAGQLEEQVDAAARVIAAATLAGMVRWRQGSLGEWLCWAGRAAGLEHEEFSGAAAGAPGGAWCPLTGETWAEPGAPRVRHCFRLLVNAAPGRARELAQARDAALALLADEGPAIRSHLRLPVLLARERRGYLSWLWLERLDPGSGAFFQDPTTLLDPLRTDLREAIEAASGQAAGQCLHVPSEDVRWRLSALPVESDGVPIAVHGTSAQAAAAVGLLLLLRGEAPDPRCAISATVREDGTLGPVAGICSQGGPKLRAARALRGHDSPAVVIVSPENRLTAAEEANWLSEGVRIQCAGTVMEALALARPPGVPAATAADPAGQVLLIHDARSQPDRYLARFLETQLVAHGYSLLDEDGREAGPGWAEALKNRIQGADAVVALLSATSVESELVIFKLQLAGEARAHDCGPAVLPVCMGEPEPFPASVAGVVGPPPHIHWREPADDEAVVKDLLAALARLPRAEPLRPEERWVPPTGVVPLGSRFYVVRPTDAEFRAALTRRDSIIRIKGPRQVGKTSLLARGLEQARAAGARVVLTDLQALNAGHCASAGILLTTLAGWIVQDLGLSAHLEAVWDPQDGPSRNFRNFMLRHVLGSSPSSLVWALDETDRLFSCSFASEIFGLLRSWHNERALHPALPWPRLTVVLAYATEAHLFISDLNQSPFNVGTRVALHDFTPEQLKDLNERYGAPLRGEAELAECYRLLSGQPFLTHRAIHALAAGEIRFADLAKEGEHDGGLFGDHLRHLMVLLAADADLGAAAREVVHSRRCPSADSFYRLRSAGVVAGETPEQARPHCLLYARYLGRHLP
jgi:hypothetical protein